MGSRYEESLKYLETKLSSYESEKDKTEKYYRKFIASFVFAIILFCIVIITAFIFTFGYYGVTVLLIMMFMIAFVSLAWAVLSPLKNRIGGLQSYIDETNDELELHKLKTEDERVISEKQFKIHQRQLNRYYDENLSQIKILSRLGTVLIVVGVLTIAVSAFHYIEVEHEDNLVLIIGSVSGLLFNAIGAFFIAMYTQSMKVAISLHSKLVGSNDLLLANLLISKIENKDLRDKAWADASKNISRNNLDKITSKEE